MQYDVYGKVRQEKMKLVLNNYSGTNYCIEDITPKSILCLLANNTMPYINYFEEDLCLQKVQQLESRKLNSSIPMRPEVVVIDNKIITTINTDRVFRNKDEICYKNKSYPITYRYDIEKNKHEIYIDYTIEMINLNWDNIKCIENEVLKLINDYNNNIDK
jgi:hypothetical protein